MTDDRRSIELEIEVPGTVDDVWRAVGTGPGISSWYVPHTLEERSGGAASASFGDAPEMQIQGRVAEWDPPHRIVMDGGDPTEGLVFEWQVEAAGDDRCVVRLINSGFGSGAEYDDQFDAMHEGWLIFMSNLRLHLLHHPGAQAAVKLPMTYVAAPSAQVWSAAATAFGVPETAAVGDRITTSGDGVPHLSGIVAEISNPAGRERTTKFLLRVDDPVPGTAFLGAEAQGPMTGLSAWTYLYGEEASASSDELGAGFQRVIDEVAAGFAASEDG